MILLKGEKEEIILREREQLTLIASAVQSAKELGADGEELTKLTQLSNALFSKIDLPGTKAQLKPVYSKRQAGQVRSLTKLTLVFKWGGEFTHSAKYQSRDLGENMKKDISIMNREVLKNVQASKSVHHDSCGDYKRVRRFLHLRSDASYLPPRYLLLP